MKVMNESDLLGTWDVKQYVKKDGTLKVHDKPKGLKLIFSEGGSAKMKVVIFTISNLGWELKDGKLILIPATKGKPPIEIEITDEGLAWDNPNGQRTWFAKIS